MADDGLESFVTEMADLYKVIARGNRLLGRDEVFCHGLTVLQAETLDEIAKRDSVNMNELSAIMFLARSTMTRVVDPLVERGLVSRYQDPRDRRVVYLKSTEEGQQARQIVMRCLLDAQKEVLSKIKPGDRDTVLYALRELVKAMTDWRQTCC
ncbi:MAG: MarR family winged helix-turn-helix transcriptional regulator [Chloroflexi bacterium]|nr:MarR family winged helix-turn-helix transcriptional regulator [Chloroflexota bacterium]